MRSKQFFSSKKELLGMVKPEITKIDPKDPNVVSELTNRNLFTANTAKNGDADVDVAGNSDTSTLFHNHMLATSENLTLANKLHDLMLDYYTQMSNALNLAKKNLSGVFNVTKFVTDVEEHLDLMLLTTVSFLSEHVKSFGSLLNDYANVVDRVVARMCEGTRNAARGIHGPSVATHHAYSDAIMEAEDYAEEFVKLAEEYKDVPYVDEAEQVDLKPGVVDSTKGEVNS